MPEEKKEKETLKLCLIVEIEYDQHTTTEAQLRAHLLGAIHREFANGAITGETDAEVHRYQAYVSRFTRDFDDIPTIEEKVKEDSKKVA